MAEIFSDYLEPHRQGASEPEVCEFGNMGVAMRVHDVDIDFVDEFKTVVAVGVISVIDSFEQGIALAIQELLRDVGVPVEDSRDYLLIGVIVYVLHRVMMSVFGVSPGKRYVEGLRRWMPDGWDF